MGAAAADAIVPRGLDRSDLATLHVLGQVESEFVLCVTRGGMLVAVDQHAADERVRLECLTDMLMAALPPSTGYNPQAASQQHAATNATGGGAEPVSLARRSGQPATPGPAGQLDGAPALVVARPAGPAGYLQGSLERPLGAHRIEPPQVTTLEGQYSSALV